MNLESLLAPKSCEDTRLRFEINLPRFLARPEFRMICHEVRSRRGWPYGKVLL